MIWIVGGTVSRLLARDFVGVGVPLPVAACISNVVKKSALMVASSWGVSVRDSSFHSGVGVGVFRAKDIFGMMTVPQRIPETSIHSAPSKVILRVAVIECIVTYTACLFKHVSLLYV